jgi:hypothetical protein
MSHLPPESGERPDMNMTERIVTGSPGVAISLLATGFVGIREARLFLLASGGRGIRRGLINFLVEAPLISSE